MEQVPSDKDTTITGPAAGSGDRSPRLRWHFKPYLKYKVLWRHVASGKRRYHPELPHAIVLLCWAQAVVVFAPGIGFCPVSPREDWLEEAAYGPSVAGQGSKARFRRFGLRKPRRVILHEGNRFRCESCSDQFRRFYISGVRTPGHSSGALRSPIWPQSQGTGTLARKGCRNGMYRGSVGSRDFPHSVDSTHRSRMCLTWHEVGKCKF